MTNISEHSASTVVLDIRGMRCGACEKHIGEALATVPGVSVLTVNRNPGTATVEWTTGAPDLGALVDAVRSAGYDARVSRVSGEVTMAPPTPPAAGTCRCCQVPA